MTMYERYGRIVKSLRFCMRIEDPAFECIEMNDGCCDSIGRCIPHLMDEAADAIEELSKPKWIPVTERLPEEEQPVLVVRKFLGVKGQVPSSVYVEIAERIGDDWCADSDEYKIARLRHTNPTHWMPLPEPPKEET